MPAEMRPLGDDLAAAGHAVLGVRLAGHGTHPEDLNRTRWEDWIATVADATALLGAERTVLLGQSLGGMVALVAASLLPADGVVTLNTPGDFRGPAPRSLRPHRVVPKPTAPDSDLGIRREADYPAYAGEPPGIRREVWELGRELERVLPTLRTAALIVGSNDDPWVPAANSQRLAGLLPNAELLVVDGPGHAITLDPKGGEVFAAVRAFVAACSEATPRSH